MDVHTVLDRNERGEVSGRVYRYQACIETSAGIRHIFRYDNSDQKVREGHADAYHKHVHDPMCAEETDRALVWVGQASWPTLGSVLRELQAWWKESGQYLDFEDS